MSLTCLQIHNDYQIPGGETKTAEGIAELLEKFGVKTIRYYKTNSCFKNKGLVDKAVIGAKSLYNSDIVKELQDILNREKIDFALIHNVLPIISNSAYDILEKNRIPIIKYIQNYNLICINGAIDHGIVCKKCKNNSFYGVYRRCYKKNFIYSLIRYVIKRNFDRKYYSNISLLMSNSKFVMNKHLEFGLNESKMKVMYNYIEPKKYEAENQFNSYYLYFGRIAREKGIFTVLEAAERLPKIKFCFMGRGELSNELKSTIKQRNLLNVDFIGGKDGNEMFKILANAKATIVSSEWDEPLPRTLLESFSVGTPVIGSNRGGIVEMLNSEIGYLYESGNTNDLVLHIQLMEKMEASRYQEMRTNCIKEVENKYTQEKYFERFIDCVKRVIKVED